MNIEYTPLISHFLSTDEHIEFASGRIYDLIEQENGLRNNRMMWFANIEGFLWLSFAAVISKEVGWENGFWLLIAILTIGILVCLSAISAISTRILLSSYSSRSGELYNKTVRIALML